ncbi:MAG TPA: tetratricopeptide repeat protein [Chthoniobacterales bacterium]|nr:tetratricopeptide repeat protein [Chthoniobacterales bacterium]
MKIRIGFSCAVLWLVGGSILMAQPSAQFAKANQEYSAGDFKAAIADYEELVRSGEDTPNVFYNLGDAYFRQNNFGRAILNYERALALEPHHPEAQANLRVARDEARALELLPSRWERLFALANENQYAVTAAVAFWIGIFSIAAWIFGRRRSRSAIALSILSLSIFALAVVAVYQLSHGKNGRGLAIVTGENVEARLATADNANRVLTLPAGSEIQIVSQRGDWIYAALPNNLRGWMPANSAEQVRM